MKKLFLLDAYALIFRAYYALIRMPRMTRDGFNTSAIFGFVNTLEEVIRKEKPTHIAVCFDPAGPTFRSEAFADYKGEREATPEDIRKSIPIIKEIVKAYGIPVIEVEGYEADDVIGTLSKRASKEGYVVYMMTPDKDFGQLVEPNILQYKPSYRGQDFELRGEEEVCNRYDIQKTSQVIDLLALMGDKIDNIPGCPGVGEKTAIKLIKDFGDVETLVENTYRLKGALKKKIEENKEQILFSKFLATIKTDVPIDLKLEATEMTPPDRDKLFAIFRDLEFKSLLERVRKRLDAESPGGKTTSGLPKKEMFGKIRVGDQVTARISSVKEDGKLDLCLREKAYIQIGTDSKLVLERLKNNGGKLDFNDKASPALIRERMDMSKNEFKRAVGHLLKEGYITIKENGIFLNDTFRD